MAYLLDGAILLVFILAIVIGYKRGFVKTMAGLVAFVAAALVAFLLSGPIAQFIYDSSIEPKVVSTITQHLEETGGSLEAGVDKALETLPGFITNALANSGVESGADVVDKLAGTEGEQSLAQRVAEQMVEPVVVPLLKVVCLLLLFVIAYIVAVILLRVLNVVAKLPLLKQLNEVLGVAAGAVTGALWTLLLVSLLQLLAATGAADGAITQELLNETILVNWLISINPAANVLQEVMTLVGE